MCIHNKGHLFRWSTSDVLSADCLTSALHIVEFSSAVSSGKLPTFLMRPASTLPGLGRLGPAGVLMTRRKALRWCHPCCFGFQECSRRSSFSSSTCSSSAGPKQAWSISCCSRIELLPLALATKHGLLGLLGIFIGLDGVHCKGTFGSKEFCHIDWLHLQGRISSSLPPGTQVWLRRFCSSFCRNSPRATMWRCCRADLAVFYLCTPFIINCNVSNPVMTHEQNGPFLRQMKPSDWCLQLADPWLRSIICPQICPKDFCTIGGEPLGLSKQLVQGQEIQP